MRTNDNLDDDVVVRLYLTAAKTIADVIIDTVRSSGLPSNIQSSGILRALALNAISEGFKILKDQGINLPHHPNEDNPVLPTFGELLIKAQETLSVSFAEILRSCVESFGGNISDLTADRIIGTIVQEKDGHTTIISQEQLRKTKPRGHIPKEKTVDHIQ